MLDTWRGRIRHRRLCLDISAHTLHLMYVLIMSSLDKRGMVISCHPIQ